MKVEELMIEDWVRVNDPNGPFISRVYGLSLEPSAIYAKEPDLTVAYPYDEDCVDPIPLTPEILEKNGFQRCETESTSLAENWGWHEKVTGRVYNRSVRITFYKEPIIGVLHLTEIETCSQKGDGVDQIHSCDIDYIHELQHALRICGIEKEIDVN